MKEQEGLDYIKRMDRIGFISISIILLIFIIGLAVYEINENVGNFIFFSTLLFGLIMILFASYSNNNFFKENKK